MISSRALEDLTSQVRAKALAHIAKCKAIGIDLLIYCTYRDEEAQAELYSHGRAKPGPIVTNARAGESFHNYKCAYDCVPLVGGKPAWDDAKLYTRVGECGEAVGLEWAGRWKGKFKETAHFQYSSGLSLQELQSGKVPL